LRHRSTVSTSDLASSFARKHFNINFTLHADSIVEASKEQASKLTMMNTYFWRAATLAAALVATVSAFAPATERRGSFLGSAIPASVRPTAGTHVLSMYGYSTLGPSTVRAYDQALTSYNRGSEIDRDLYSNHMGSSTTSMSYSPMGYGGYGGGYGNRYSAFIDQPYYQSQRQLGMGSVSGSDASVGVNGAYYRNYGLGYGNGYGNNYNSGYGYGNNYMQGNRFQPYGNSYGGNYNSYGGNYGGNYLQPYRNGGYGNSYGYGNNYMQGNRFQPYQMGGMGYRNNYMNNYNSGYGGGYGNNYMQGNRFQPYGQNFGYRNNYMGNYGGGGYGYGNNYMQGNRFQPYQYGGNMGGYRNNGYGNNYGGGYGYGNNYMQGNRLQPYGSNYGGYGSSYGRNMNYGYRNNGYGQSFGYRNNNYMSGNYDDSWERRKADFARRRFNGGLNYGGYNGVGSLLRDASSGYGGYNNRISPYYSGRQSYGYHDSPLIAMPDRV
jgi:hypothetical protein